MTTYLFGMAKSSLNLIGAKRQKLELDYLRLAYVCQHYQRLGFGAFGILAVTTKEIEAQAKAWQVTYRVPAGLIKILPAELSGDELAELIQFQAMNRQAMSGSLATGKVAPYADASFGRELIEGKLHAYVRDKCPGLKLETDCRDEEMRICWDLFACTNGHLPAL